MTGLIEARYLDVAGSTAYVEIAGTGTPVLCVHTAGQSGVQWRQTTARLAALGHQVVVPDLPGHGRSDPAPGGPVQDLQVYSDWCAALIDALGLDRPYVVGCSIGGKTVLDLAVRHGDRISGVVAMAAEASPGHVGLSGLRRELQDVAAPSRSDRTYLGTLAALGRSVPAELAERIARMHRREDPEVSVSDLIGWGTHDVRDGLKDIVCPVQLVAGADDPWIDTGRVRATAAEIPDGRHTVLEGIGHYPMEEMKDFAMILHGWLAELNTRDEVIA
ncbi:alpha/beta hydrolase [Streptomyces shenzhenensis]|uniref:alpha/beta fold hydrolase n=1 Tax=Streptomyces shenzhenensis TaxID=943815 RepID=UPI0033C4B30A